MVIRIETQWTTVTTEFCNSDITIPQIAEALQGMLVSQGWDIEIIKEYIKTENEDNL